MIKYYELASQVLSLYEDVLNFKENEDLLHELLEVCLEDVNLDQLTNIYRFSADDSALGYDMADVGEFVIQFKQTYPKPLDISHFKFDAFGNIYTKAFKKIVDKIVHKELRSPKGLTINKDKVEVNGEVVASFNSYEAVRPGVLIYQIDKNEINYIINNSEDLKNLIRAVMVYERYAIKQPEQMKSLKEAVKEVVKEVVKVVPYKYEHHGNHKDGFEAVINQIIDQEISIPGVLVEDGEITINDSSIGFISIDEDSYTIEYDVTDVTMEKRVNNNQLLLKYIDLLRSLLVTTVE